MRHKMAACRIFFASFAKTAYDTLLARVCSDNMPGVKWGFTRAPHQATLAEQQSRATVLPTVQDEGGQIRRTWQAVEEPRQSEYHALGE